MARPDGFPLSSPLPPWVIFHVPHDSTDIPDDVMDQFTLSGPSLGEELLRMTDHHSLDLLVPGGCRNPQAVRSPVSRLVVDMERFPDDSQEVMASVGMGVVYERTSGGEPLRRPLSMAERARLIEKYYVPHHARLKEKLGGLCFYVSNAPPELAELITEAERRSQVMCEVCSEPGRIRSLEGRLICLCDTHFEEEERQLQDEDQQGPE